MTKEQLTERADAYARKVAESYITDKKIAYDRAFRDYLAGAHSRDKEIDNLSNAVVNMSNAIEHLSHPWKSVDEGWLPEIKQRLLVMYADGTVNFGYYENGSFHDYRLRDDELWFRVTHWMQIPTRPKGGD